MSQISVYNTSTQTEDDIKINVFDNDAFNAFIAQGISSFVYDGITWNVTKTQSSDFTVLELTTSQNINNFDIINGMFNSIELGGNITEDDCMQLILEDIDGNYIYQKDDNTSYPYLRYNHSYNPQQFVNSYNISANKSSGVSYGVALGAGGNAFTYGKINAYEIPDSELSFYGFTAILANAGGTTITLCRASGISSTNYVEVEASQGDKGFIPIRPGYNPNGRGGGGHSKQKALYPSDDINNPGEPDEEKASIIRAGFINVYDITESELSDLGVVLCGSNFWSKIESLFRDAMACIISLNIFPYTPHVGSVENIRLLRWPCTALELGKDVRALRLSQQFRTVTFGSITVPEMFESYLDYDASSCSLYLPFIGEVDIDISEVMGCTITVDYTIDFFTGMCVANVNSKKYVRLSPAQVAPHVSQHSYQGNCAVQVPLSGVGYSNLVGSLVNAASVGLKGGVQGAAVQLAADVASGGFKPSVTTKGSIGANAGYCSIMYPYLTITRPITMESDSFQEVSGYPSYTDSKLATCQGLCVCADINLSGLTGATDSEISRIKQMCKEGIYI